MILTQLNRDLEVTTPLGPDVLLLTRFSGEERFSQCYQYDLEFLSGELAIKPEDIVGKKISWSLRLADGTPRMFSGYVKHFAGGMRNDQLRRYRAEVVPWLWFLTRRTNCRIFQEKTLEGILDDVFGEYGDLKTVSVKGTLPSLQREYCVQYRESDFNFVSRLLEEEGVYYYFEHSQDGHTLVLCGESAGHEFGPDKLIHFEPNAGTQEVEDGITDWEDGYELVSRQYAARDFNFKTPTDMLEESLPTDTAHNLPQDPAGQELELFDYPGLYADHGGGAAVVKRRMQEEEARYRTCQAQTTVRSLAAGTKFTLDEFQTELPAPAERTWLLASVRQEASEPTSYRSGTVSSDGFSYHNEISGILAKTPYRPPQITRKPVVEGPQTATVTGPPGSKVSPDEYGRVKVQFHWDRKGKNNEQSSCWIRVSQLWASKGWGSVQHPWVGDEVIVDFLEGDPDRPIITGRVYNETHKPPKGRDDAHEGDHDGVPIEERPFRNYVARDNLGNEIYFDSEEESDSRIVLSNITSEGENWIKMEDGRVAIHQCADKEEITIGNSAEHTVGQTTEHFVGEKSSVQIGAITNVTVGVATNIRVGGFFSTDIGVGTEFFAGGKLSACIGPEFKLIGSDSKFEFNEGGHTKKASKSIKFESNSGISALCGGPNIGQAGTNAWHAIRPTVLGKHGNPAANSEAMLAGMSQVNMKPMGVRIAQWENPHQFFFKILKPIIDGVHTVATVPATAATAIYSAAPPLMKQDLFLPMLASNASVLALAALLKAAEKTEQLMTFAMMLKEEPKSEIFVGMDEIRLAMPGKFDSPVQLYVEKEQIGIHVGNDSDHAWIIVDPDKIYIRAKEVDLGNANDGVKINGPLAVGDSSLNVDEDGQEETKEERTQGQADLSVTNAVQGED